jgi:hypothetical protein
LLTHVTEPCALDLDAFGHVTLDFQTLSGEVTLDRGTGRFRGFHASVDVTYDARAGLWHWDGTYRFTPPGHDR